MMPEPDLIKQRRGRRSLWLWYIDMLWIWRVAEFLNIGPANPGEIQEQARGTISCSQATNIGSQQSSPNECKSVGGVVR